MFGLGWAEIMVVGVVALIVIGPRGVTSCIPKSWSVYRKSQGNGPRIYHGYERSR